MPQKLKRIERDLKFPGVYASVVTCKDPKGSVDWYVRFLMPGPDRRFNPAIAVVPAHKLPKLISNLENAYQGMNSLSTRNLSDRLTEVYVDFGDVSDTLSIALEVELYHFLFWTHRNVKLNFLVSSKTQIFRCSFDANASKSVIEKLKSANYIAKELIQST